jgi:hypothetical protein
MQINARLGLPGHSGYRSPERAQITRAVRPYYLFP